MAAVNLGLSDNARRQVAESLGAILADHYLLALKTQNFHWNVTGPNFQGLHALFGAQYAALHAALDEVAERIRTLGFPAPGGFVAYGKLATLPEAKGGESWGQMCEQLAADNDSLVQRCRPVRELAESLGDAETGDLMIERMDALAKAAWMLRSHVG
ncbi:Dps family protein [Reyranella sp. CPCC 100927]|uniref:Dps family protein n=1 Tax=Reyranella sp. CPCC 100927 TaxID=2599616 RepID=UPI0011B57268|nr:Dps family protein [Reyranella sp. CPCC 100927]TWT03062.1 DNA starvation/stationary phase protection protein [Reyranella sp. CPCC 100927]